MLSAKEIRNVTFSKSVGGYKQEEVDILLDKIEADYDNFERTVREFNAKIGEMQEEIEGYRSSQNSIQSVLLSAQKLADQIVNEAKTKSEQIISGAQESIANITAKEKELSAAFDKKAEERKEKIEREVTKIVDFAKEKSESIEKATQDSVERQQALFNRIKIEMSQFKSDIIKRYKEHLEILNELPDTVSMSPEEMARAVSQDFGKAPDPSDFLKEIEEETEADADFIANETGETQITEENEETVPQESGFSVIAPQENDVREEEF